MEKESIEEREKRERIAKEKEAQEEAERKLKEEKATGSIHDDGITADQQSKTGVVEVQSLRSPFSCIVRDVSCGNC